MSEIISLIGNAIIAFLIITILIVILKIVNFLYLKLTKKKSKLSYYLKYSFILLIFGFGILFVSIVITFENKYIDSSPTSLADGFTIEEYKILLNVDKKNIVDVTEIVTVNFYESGHRGIYKFIPTWLEYTGKDGNAISRESKISDLKAVGDKYLLDTVNGKERIKIGDPNYTLSTGDKTYTITYKYDMGSDPFKGFDEFIFHNFGDFWGTRIKNASIELTMPESFEKSNVKFFADKYRKYDITSKVNYYVVDNTLYASLSDDYSLMKSLTLDIELPENYFISGNNNYGYVCMFICLIIIVFAIISYIKWNKYGKDLDKYSETVEFYPPEKLDAAEIGYLYKNDSGRKLAISLIVELASKGYIKIEESKDKKTRTIINMCKLDIDAAINRTINIVKLKDYENHNGIQNKNEKELMEFYFANSNKSVITENFEEFYIKASYLINNGYIKIEKDSINDYSESAINKIKEQLMLEACQGKEPLTENEKIIYDKLFKKSDENILDKDTEFYTVFKDISDNVSEKYDDKINDVNAYKNMLSTSILFFVSSISWALAYTSIEDLDPKYSLLYYVSLICIFVIFIFAILMKRKNNYGEQIIAKIKGFKNYLETAEKNQINQLAEKNPNYFYDILPYAYVLGVSKIWIEKFENIPIPKNDMGNFDYCSMDSFNTLSDSVNVPSSSSTSSCGGGCSSCGGGGSW